MEKQELKNLIKEQVSKVGSKLSPEQREMQENALYKIIQDGKKPYEAMDMPKETVEFLYSQAFRDYNSGQYLNARTLFYILLSLDNKDIRFAYGIAACQHMMKEWDDAFYAYCRCLSIEPQSPLIYYHMADCFLQQDKKIEAALMLRMSLRHVGQDPSVGPLKVRAEQMYKKLIDEINQGEAAQKTALNQG